MVELRQKIYDSFNARKPLRMVSSASSGERPSVSSFSSWSPAILPMAASWISWASGQLAVMAGMDSMWACPMMMESHCTWPKHWLLPTITGWNT